MRSQARLPRGVLLYAIVGQRFRQVSAHSSASFLAVLTFLVVIRA